MFKKFFISLPFWVDSDTVPESEPPSNFGSGSDCTENDWLCNTGFKDIILVSTLTPKPLPQMEEDNHNQYLASNNIKPGEMTEGSYTVRQKGHSSSLHSYQGHSSSLRSYQGQSILLR